MRDLMTWEVEDLQRRFGYHQPSTTQVAANHQHWRAECGHLAATAMKTLPPGRELSLVLTHLEEAQFWGNAAIAREQYPLEHETPKVEVRSAGDPDPLGEHGVAVARLLPKDGLPPVPMVNRPGVQHRDGEPR
jgi:hypothetical protein